MSILDYRETLDIVEEFMVSSRIREYCTTICKGKCCTGCYEKNEEACHRQEGRRLSCSIFLCIPLYNYIPKDSYKVLINAKNAIIKEYHKFSKKNIYFYAPSEKFFKESRFPEYICKLNDKNIIKEVNIAMTKLINYNRHLIKFKYRDGFYYKNTLQNKHGKNGENCR